MPLTGDVPIRRKRTPRADALEARLGVILQVAGEMFARNGFHGTSVRDVAAASGLSAAGLLHHYPEKAALLEAALDHHLKVITETFGLATDDGEVFLRGLVAAAERAVENPLELRLYTVLGTEALAQDHPAHGYFQRWYATVRRRLQEAFDDLDRRGLYRAPVPTETAALQVAAFQVGLNQYWFTGDRVLDLAGTLRSMLGLYVTVDLTTRVR